MTEIPIDRKILRGVRNDILDNKRRAE